MNIAKIYTFLCSVVFLSGLQKAKQTRNLDKLIK